MQVIGTQQRVPLHPLITAKVQRQTEGQWVPQNAGSGTHTSGRVLWVRRERASSIGREGRVDMSVVGDSGSGLSGVVVCGGKLSCVGVWNNAAWDRVVTV